MKQTKPPLAHKVIRPEPYIPKDQWNGIQQTLAQAKKRNPNPTVVRVTPEKSK